MGVKIGCYDNRSICCLEAQILSLIREESVFLMSTALIGLIPSTAFPLIPVWIPCRLVVNLCAGTEYLFITSTVCIPEYRQHRCSVRYQNP